MALNQADTYEDDWMTWCLRDPSKILYMVLNIVALVWNLFVVKFACLLCVN